VHLEVFDALVEIARVLDGTDAGAAAGVRVLTAMPRRASSSAEVAET
jgi:hypothetical protein